MSEMELILQCDNPRRRKDARKQESARITSPNDNVAVSFPASTAKR